MDFYYRFSDFPQYAIRVRTEMKLLLMAMLLLSFLCIPLIINTAAKFDYGFTPFFHKLCLILYSLVFMVFTRIFS